MTGNSGGLESDRSGGNSSSSEHWYFSLFLLLQSQHFHAGVNGELTNPPEPRFFTQAGDRPERPRSRVRLCGNEVRRLCGRQAAISRQTSLITLRFSAGRRRGKTNFQRFAAGKKDIVLLAKPFRGH